MILNSGLEYGKVCLPDTAYHDVDPVGCPIARYKKNPRNPVPGGFSVKYDFIIDTPTPAGSLKALLTFSQPVRPGSSSVTFSGQVLIIGNLKSLELEQILSLNFVVVSDRGGGIHSALPLLNLEQ